MSQKLLTQIERDIRNQVMFDQMKRLGPAARAEVFVRGHALPLLFGVLAVLWTAYWIVVILHANGDM